MYLGHVNIHVRNAERARDWYTRILGLHTYHFVPGRAAFLSADLNQSHEVALMETGEAAATPGKGTIGLHHFAWMVDSLDALKVQYQRLCDNGVAIDAIVDHGISLGIYFRDPDGNGIEVAYELPRAEWPVQEQIFGLPPEQRGRFPGPWDSDPAMKTFPRR